MMSVILKREPPDDLLFSRRENVGPDGRLHVIPEAVRRGNDLRDIGQDHRLFGLINQCLENKPALRPTSAELSKELERAYSEEVDAARAVRSRRAIIFYSFSLWENSIRTSISQSTKSFITRYIGQSQ